MPSESLTTQNPIETSANYEGNHTLLFLERLNNPKVRAKLVESLTSEHLFEHKLSEKDHDLIRKIVEDALNQRIKLVFNSTNVVFDEKHNPAFGDLNEPGWVCPYAEQFETGERYSKKFLSIAEAHEKGHGVRKYNPGSDVGKWIESGFDFSNVKIREEDIVPYRAFINKHRETPLSDEEIRKEAIRTFQRAPHELVERMAQLKNYFGMKGDEKFTKEHLEYARKHYGKYMGWPMQTNLFFDSITEETEVKFLEVINNLGV